MVEGESLAARIKVRVQTFSMEVWYNNTTARLQICPLYIFGQGFGFDSGPNLQPCTVDGNQDSSGKTKPVER